MQLAAKLMHRIAFVFMPRRMLMIETARREELSDGSFTSTTGLLLHTTNTNPKQIQRSMYGMPPGIACRVCIFFVAAAASCRLLCWCRLGDFGAPGSSAFSWRIGEKREIGDELVNLHHHQQRQHTKHLSSHRNFHQSMAIHHHEANNSLRQSGICSISSVITLECCVGTHPHRR